MSTTSVKSNTIRLHRVLRAPLERVYRAFLDADALVKWIPPNGLKNGSVATYKTYQQ